MMHLPVSSKVCNLVSLLSHYFQEDVEILEENYSHVTGPGEHYGSVMLAIETKVKRINGEQEKLHLVAKLPPVNDLLKLAFDIKVTFKKEVIAYTKSIPELLKLQKEYNVEKKIYMDNLFPTCYAARISLCEDSDEVDDDAVLILENLKLQGYKTEDRLVGFDLDETRLVVRNLATFHATAIALKILKPDKFEETVRRALVQNNGLEQLPSEVGEAFHNVIMEVANTIEDLSPYLESLQKIVDYYAIHPFVNRPPPKEPWGTIQHCDFWTSNTMLLRDNNGKPLSNKIIDLQLMCYSTAPRDLIFFLFTSVINSVLDNYYNDFIQIYYNSFINTLEDYPIDISDFSWDSFQEELNNTGPEEIYHVLTMLKPICTERSKIIHSAEEFVPSDWSRKDLLGDHHRNKLKDTVMAFAKRKWL